MIFHQTGACWKASFPDPCAGFLFRCYSDPYFARQANEPALPPRLVGTKPIVYEDGDSVTLQFRIGEIQSEMLASDPSFLVLSYTRTMMAFMLFNKEPKRIAMIGLGGGSMPKWCYHELPKGDITVFEINQMVISLREQFYIPADDDRFRVVCGDGADYVADTTDSPEVLLVDGFDIHGQPSQLCSQKFYDDCYRALGLEGLLVVNLCSHMDQQLIARIRTSLMIESLWSFLKMGKTRSYSP